MAEKFYRQCVLRRGKTEQVSWIPEKFAQKTRPVKLKKDDGSWDDGWVVESVGSRASEDEVSLMERDHLRTRKHSDI